MSKITVSALIDAESAKVWDYWTQPEHIVHWNAASDDWHCPRASNDLRAGGSFSATMAARDGSMSFDFEGVYDEVIDQHKLVYSLADGRQVSVAFEAAGDQTNVVETFDPENINPEDMQRAGWQAILDNFKAYVERG